jgi:hypothetical protein
VRIRSDSIVVSSALHTVALLSFVWAGLGNYISGSAVILIGLIVVWTGYVKRSRSAWLVMFAIVWLWAFPIFVLPFVGGFVRGKLGLLLSELETVVAFCMMVTGLVLPIRKFFSSKTGEESQHPPTAMLT